jgi:hypothetical protein
MNHDISAAELRALIFAVDGKAKITLDSLVESYELLGAEFGHQVRFLPANGSLADGDNQTVVVNAFLKQLEEAGYVIVRKTSQ